jgi:hypothetical protein
MPAIHHDFDKMGSSCGQARRRNRRRSNLRSTGRSPPLGILMIKTLSMIVIRERVGGSVEVKMWETWRSAARQQDAQSGYTHDRRAVESQSAVALPEDPDKRHACTPQR